MSDALSKTDTRIETFAREWLIDRNGKRAAIAAGCKPKGAAVQASRWLKNPNVIALVERLLNESYQRLDIDRDKIIGEVGKIAFTDMGDFMRLDTEKGEVTIDAAKVYEYMKIDGTKALDANSRPFQTAAIQEFRVDEIKEGKGDKETVRKVITFKLANKLAALELLGRSKQFKEWSDRVEVGMEDEVKVAAFLARQRRNANPPQIEASPERPALNA